MRLKMESKEAPSSKLGHTGEVADAPHVRDADAALR
jgi:hypothetical protein